MVDGWRKVKAFGSFQMGNSWRSSSPDSCRVFSEVVNLQVIMLANAKDIAEREGKNRGEQKQKERGVDRQVIFPRPVRGTAAVCKIV